MILVDTSVWIAHFRAADGALAALLEAGTVLTHPFVIGELALGNLPERDVVLRALKRLSQAPVATDQEVLLLISRHALFGRGIGYVDVHLLAAAHLAAAGLWTRDQRLQGVADRLGLAASLLR
jgi:predicted nucleic acid-binding protein